MSEDLHVYGIILVFCFFQFLLFLLQLLAFLFNNSISVYEHEMNNTMDCGLVPLLEDTAVCQLDLWVSLCLIECWVQGPE